jgi:hypothetical protein
MFVLRRQEPDPVAATRELRKRHTEHLVALWRAGITIRTIRRFRLDDPRITEEVRALMVKAAMKRRRTAGAAPRADMATLIKLSNFVPASDASCVAVAAMDNQGSGESLQARAQAARDVTGSEELQRTIDLIRKRVCAEFHLAEVRDPNLTARSHRQIYAFPRQLAMYIARHVTGASLQEIGRHFGGRHHTTVLHSINKVEQILQSDRPLNQIVKRLLERGKLTPQRRRPSLANIENRQRITEEPAGLFNRV